jgi:DNase/tRNase domain of colicin-like bacteriocin
MYFFWKTLWHKYKHTLGKSSRIIAYLLILFEILCSAYDFRATQLVLSDPHARFSEKAIMITGTLLGIVIEGGGYGSMANKILKNSDEGIDLAKIEVKADNLAELPLVNGQKIKNADQAGTFVQTESGFRVFIKENGFPDFSPFSKKNVQIEGMTGLHHVDFVKANKAAGFGNTPDAHTKFNNGEFADYTWHHHEDTKTMQLVPKALNNPKNEGLLHTGGAAVSKHNKNFPDQKLEFPSPKLD